MRELPDSARKVLEGKNFVFFATLNRDGSPQVTPMWVDTDGTHILVNTAVGRVKQRNVKRDPRVAVAIVEQSNPYKMVAIQGRVVEQTTGPEAETHIDKLAMKYMGVQKYQRRRPEQRIILKIEPKSVAGMG